MSFMSFFGLSVPPGVDPIHNFFYGDVPRSTSSGVSVNENTALNYSVCWAATRLLAGTAGWLPLNLYERLPSGGAVIAKSHRVHRLIHDQPNGEMGAMMFRARGVNHQVNWGNTFNEIVRDASGLPVALEPIHPSRVPTRNIKRENGQLVYYVLNPSGSTTRIAAENMFHVPSIISDDGVIGKGVVTAARETIGKAMGTQSHGAASIKNGGSPPLALKNGKFKSAEDLADFRQQINKEHTGPENAGKWLILPNPEAEVQMLGFSLQDSQFIESQQFDIEEMSRWYGVPPHLVGHLLRATFNNIEELGISFVKYSLILWLKLWEQEIWRKLLTKREQETHYAKFVVDALERGNLATRTEAGVQKFFNGLWTLNQWAEQEDMNPITETVMIDGVQTSLGEVRFVQQAMIPLSMAAQGMGMKQEEKPESPKAKEEKPDLAAAIGEALAPLNATLLSIGTRMEAMASESAAIQARQGEVTAAVTGLGCRLDTFAGEIVPRVDGLTERVLKVQHHAEELAARVDAQSQAMLRDSWDRLLSVEINGVKRAAEKRSRFDKWMSELCVEHVDKLTKMLGRYLDSDRAAAAAKAHVDESTRQLAEAVKGLSPKATDAELSKAVEACVSKWHEERVMP